LSCQLKCYHNDMLLPANMENYQQQYYLLRHWLVDD